MAFTIAGVALCAGLLFAGFLAPPLIVGLGVSLLAFGISVRAVGKTTTKDDFNFIKKWKRFKFSHLSEEKILAKMEKLKAPFDKLENKYKQMPSAPSGEQPSSSRDHHPQTRQLPEKHRVKLAFIQTLRDDIGLQLLNTNTLPQSRSQRRKQFRKNKKQFFDNRLRLVKELQTMTNEANMFIMNNQINPQTRLAVQTFFSGSTAQIFEQKLTEQGIDEFKGLMIIWVIEIIEELSDLEQNPSKFQVMIKKKMEELLMEFDQAPIRNPTMLPRGESSSHSIDNPAFSGDSFVDRTRDNIIYSVSSQTLSPSTRGNFRKDDLPSYKEALKLPKKKA